MIDEIEVLRAFRDETPGPSTDAWIRARSAVAAARSQEEPARRRRRRGPGRLRLLSVAAVAAAAGGLLAAFLPGSPVTRAPDAANPQRAQETAYVISRVAQALSGPAQHIMVGYARTDLPPGSMVEPGTNNLHITLQSSAIPLAQSASSMASWSYQGNFRISVVAATGRPVVDEKITTDARGARVALAVLYRSRTWWRAATGPSPAPPGTARCTGSDVVIGPGGWPALLREELGCGRYAAYGRQRVDGIDAIKLTGRHGLAALWVDPVTYLPVRALLGFARERPQTDFRWRPATPASLAQLRLLVPVGFRQIRAPPWGARPARLACTPGTIVGVAAMASSAASLSAAKLSIPPSQ